MASRADKTLLLCAGLQSSGSTLISYCFLQRNDTNGVLDADNDLLPAIDPGLASPFAWYKTTISCFRLSEITQHYRDAGWDVRTLLVLRDLRAVWASLHNKSYGRNGITAEDPPLRLRIRRFIEDWRTAQANGTVLLRYEDFVESPGSALQRVCTQLDLPWDTAMLTWPKPPEHIADQKNGNGSFWSTRDANLLQTLSQYRERSDTNCIPASELAWLESEFRDFNVVNGYTLKVDRNAGATATAAPSVPTFEVTRRYKWETAQK